MRPKIGPVEAVRKDYRARGRVLKALGFKNYEAYLRGPLWRRIRKAHLAAHPDCVNCGRPATTIHHGSYDLAVMDGSDTTELYSACDDCHRKCEFGDDGEKLSLADATAKLRLMAGIRDD